MNCHSLLPASKQKFVLASLTEPSLLDLGTIHICALDPGMQSYLKVVGQQILRDSSNADLHFNHCVIPNWSATTDLHALLSIAVGMNIEDRGSGSPVNISFCYRGLRVRRRGQDGRQQGEW